MLRVHIPHIWLSLLLVIATPFLRAQEKTAPADSVAARDSLVTRFIPGLGESIHRTSPFEGLSSGEMLWHGTITVGDVFARQPAWFLRELGEPGQPSPMHFLSGDWRGVALLLDGRPLNDPVTGTYTINDLPIEYIDHIDVLTGAQALAVSGNATTAAINIITHQYSTVRPITKIRFLQGPFEHTLTDALFTQNVAPGMNLMVGVERHVTDGRFVNGTLDFWNVRTRLRYNISNRLNISVSDFYTSAVTGMNGGVWYDSTRSVFEEGLATVRYPGAQEDRSRHDLSVAAIARFLDDSLSTTQWTLYHSWMDRIYRDPLFPLHDAEGTYSWRLTGFTATQQLSGDFISGSIGAQWERRSLLISDLLGAQGQTYGALFGQARFSPLRYLVTSVSLRQERAGNVSSFSYGAELRWNLFEQLWLNASYARQARCSGFMESNWDAVLNYQQPCETHRLLTAGMQYATSSFSAAATLFHRTVLNAIQYRALVYARRIAAALESIPELQTYGALISSMIRFWKFEARGSLSWNGKQRPSTALATVPSWVATGELAYRDRLFNDKLETNIGIAARYVGDSRAFAFIPSRATLTSYQNATLGRFSTFDLFGVFSIGDAFIDLRYENVPDIHAMTTFAYPLLGRNLKFGVNWRFLD